LNDDCRWLFDHVVRTIREGTYRDAYTDLHEQPRDDRRSASGRDEHNCELRAAYVVIPFLDASTITHVHSEEFVCHVLLRDVFHLLIYRRWFHATTRRLVANSATSHSQSLIDRLLYVSGHDVPTSHAGAYVFVARVRFSEDSIVRPKAISEEARCIVSTKSM